MPSVVHKSAIATNQVVCLTQSCDVSEDGLITINARFLLRSAADSTLFEFDMEWPGGSSPRGLPRNQGGPYLLNRSFEYANGFVYVTATYVTATNPVRVVLSQNRASRSFTGTIALIANNQAIEAQAKFDYTSTVASARYTLLDRQTFTPDLTAAKINSITGVSSEVLALIAKKTIDSEDREILGRVTRVTASREVVFYQ